MDLGSPRQSEAAFASFSVALLCACSTNFQSQTAEYSDATPVTAIYLYSFLDLRQGSLGPKFLEEVKRQLNDALAQEGIRSKQLWFNESPLRDQFSLEEKGPNPANTTMRVPVGEVSKATSEEERVFGAMRMRRTVPAVSSRA